jgi:hypothetical protein
MGLLHNRYVFMPAFMSTAPIAEHYGTRQLMDPGMDRHYGQVDCKLLLWS